MRTIIIISIAFIFFSTQAFSQQATQTPNERNAEIQTSQLKESLTLTSQQESQIFNINLQAIEAISNLRSDRTASPAEVKAAWQSVQADRDAQIQQALNPTQLQTYQLEKERILGIRTSSEAVSK